MKIILLIISIIGLNIYSEGFAQALTKPITSEAKLHKLFKDEWDNRRDISEGDSDNVPDPKDHLPSVTPEYYQERLEFDKGYLNTLKSINREELTSEDKLNYDLFEFVLNNRILNAKFRSYRIPLLSDSGFHTSYLRSAESRPFKAPKDYENYISFLSDMARYFDENITNMKAGMTEGFTMPGAIMDNIVPSISAHIVKTPEESVYYRPFLKMSDVLTEEEKTSLTESAKAAISGYVIPSYQGFYDFFTGPYIGNARKTVGISDVPDGAEYYRYLVKYYTTINTTPEEVHSLGLSEVKRIRAEMEDIIEGVGFKGSFEEFLTFLRTDSQFYVTTPEQLLKEASWISKQIDGKLPAFFNTLPRLPYGVRAVPDDIAPNYTTGRYWGASKGDGHGGYFMVNTYALDKRPLYNLISLALHEGMPGHHLQNAIAQELENVPEFRLNLYPHAFGEGWGLYSEKVGIEMGLYKTPYDHFGRLSYEMWRAGRLVVDTGMHYMGWTREQAIELFVENSALSIHNINTEVDRYISWPGQALAYKMGELTFTRLREKAQDELGYDFDIREFHDQAIGAGGLPMNILEKRIDNWIRSKQIEG